MNDQSLPISEVYARIARYYDLTHAGLREDIPFVQKLARQAKGDLLELGCGTGRLLFPIAKMGIKITGLDNSPAMLEQARQHLVKESPAVQEKAILLEGDMTYFELPALFELILIGYNTFTHFSSAQMKQILSCACRHLTPTGKLFLDLPNPFNIIATSNDHTVTLERIFTDPQSSQTVMQFATTLVDIESQTLQINWWYDSLPAEGGAVQRILIQTAYHYLFLHEIERLLQMAKLNLHAVYGSYQQSPFAENAPRLLILAQKIN